MTSEQWQRVKAIVFEAQARDPASRAAFVAKACSGDEALHREVSSLLESIELARDRYETPAFDARDAQSCPDAGRGRRPEPAAALGRQPRRGSPAG